MKFYTVARVNNGQIIVSSNPFTNLDDAKNLRDDLNDSIMDGDGYDIFENLLLKNVHCDSYSNNVELSGMDLTKYKRGYILKCNKDDCRWGEKYLLKGKLSDKEGCGWWMPTQNAWFFKREYKDELLKMGAKMFYSLENPPNS